MPLSVLTQSEHTTQREKAERDGKKREGKDNEKKITLRKQKKKMLKVGERVECRREKRTT